jgi:hypothetical protein
VLLYLDHKGLLRKDHKLLSSQVRLMNRNVKPNGDQENERFHPRHMVSTISAQSNFVDCVGLLKDNGDTP